jgi:hypothetical protein
MGILFKIIFGNHSLMRTNTTAQPRTILESTNKARLFDITSINTTGCPSAHFTNHRYPHTKSLLSFLETFTKFTHNLSDIFRDITVEWTLLARTKLYLLFVFLAKNSPLTSFADNQLKHYFFLHRYV